MIFFHRETNTYANNSTTYVGIDYSAVYNKDYYYNNNPDLQETFGNNASALIRHFVTFGMSEGRQASETFDVSYYKNRYSDLQRAFGNNSRLYYLHYINNGQGEGRVSYSYSIYNGVDYSAVYDKDYYYNSYSDLQRVIGNNPTELIKHFVNSGMQEGRQASETFDVKFYRTHYSDLQRAFGNNYKSYYLHYINNGTVEGRTGFSYAFYNGTDYSDVYDKDYYYSKYSDLQRVIGNNPTELIKHFISSGMKEGRQASASFNVFQYRSMYSDLLRTFGTNYESYYMHFINHGKAEGRRGTSSANGWQTIGANKYYYQNGTALTGWQMINSRRYYFNSTGALKSLVGIDVSKHNGKVDWTKVKNDGIEFAIIRIGYGDDMTSQDDEQAIYNMSECERLGIQYGVYIYSYALSQSQVNSEVSHTLRMIKGHNPTIGVFYDMEDNTQSSNLTKDQLNTFAYSFLSQIQSKGYKAGLYANKHWLTSYLTNDSLQSFLTWIANYGMPDNQPTNYSKPYQIWQYTSTGSVAGINRDVDMNIYLLP